MRRLIDKKYFVFIIVLIVSFLTIGFSAFSSTLILNDVTSVFKLSTDIRVTDFYMSGYSNNGFSTDNDYNHDRILSTITLPNQNSTVTFKVQVTNISNRVAQIDAFTNLPENITYELSDYTLGEDICVSGSCRNGVVKEFFITFSYVENGYDSVNNPSGVYDIESILLWSFKINVNFKANIYYTPTTHVSATGNYNTEIDVDYNPYTSILSYDGQGYSQSIGDMYLDGLTFNENDVYILSISVLSGSATAGQLPPYDELRILDSNHSTISGQSSISSSGQLLVTAAGATNGSTLHFHTQIRALATFNSLVRKVTIEKQTIIRETPDSNYILPLDDPVRNGFTFDGWYTAETGGVKITEDDVITGYEDITLYAHWIDNDTITEPMISYQDNVVTDGLVRYFSARNNTGTGHGNVSVWQNLANTSTAKVTSATWTDEYLSFNGTSSNVRIGQITSTRYSMDAIVSIPEIVSGEIEIVDNFQNGGGGLVLADGKPRFQVYIGSSWRQAVAPTALELNQMYHIAGTYDGSNVKLYVNGELVTTTAATGNIVTAENSTQFFLGCNPKADACVSNYFKGNIYSVKIYNRGLTEAEVKQNYYTDALYMGRYTRIHPTIRILSGTAGLGIRGYQYSETSNIWNDYDDDNKPVIVGPTNLGARVVNMNYTPGPAKTETLYIDNDAPTGTASITVSGYTVNVTVNASDSLSGIKNYAYAFTSTSTCNDTVTGFSAATTSNTFSSEPTVPNAQYVCIKVTDNVENSLYISKKIPSYIFMYTGDYQLFTADTTGFYEVEVLGASGGGGAAGGYVSGYIWLQQNTKLYVYVGGQGPSNATTTNVGGYNGGGYSGNNSSAKSYGGGGATDIRYFGSTTPTSENLVWNSDLGLNSRIIAAGGGGGGHNNSSYTSIPGAGGGLVGDVGSGSYSSNNATDATGGTQTSGGTYGRTGQTYGDGSFGYAYQSNTSGYGGGGGSGYYGGGNGYGRAGAGGSSYMSGYAGSNSIISSSNRNIADSPMHYSGKAFYNGYMESGYNTGNGKAKITYYGSHLPTRTNFSLDSVRYVKDCVAGNTVNQYNQWAEIQIMYDGDNVVTELELEAVGTSPELNNTTRTYAYITDGKIDNISGGSSAGGFGQSEDTGNQCVTIDIGEELDYIDEIAVWHYWKDGRRYYDNITYVSEDGNIWKPVIVHNTTDPASTFYESSLGSRVTAWDDPIVPYTVNVESDTQDCPINSSYTQFESFYDRLLVLYTPSCTGYTFMGWTASGDFNPNTAMYGLNQEPTLSWVDYNKGISFENLTDVYNGEVTLTANFVATDEFPTCSISITASQITLNRVSNISAITGYDLTKSSTPSYNNNGSYTTAAGNYYGYVKNAHNYTGTCTLNVIATTSNTTYSCYKKYDACDCAACVKYNNSCWERYANQSNGTCPSGYTPYGGAYCQRYHSDYQACSGSGWTKKNKRCEKYNQSSCPSGSTQFESNTTYSCPSTHTKLNNSFCYK